MKKTPKPSRQPLRKRAYLIPTEPVYIFKSAAARAKAIKIAPELADANAKDVTTAVKAGLVPPSLVKEMKVYSLARVMVPVVQQDDEEALRQRLKAA